MQQIRDSLAAALRKEGLSAESVPLEHTADFAHGDYASGVALAYAKQAGMNPRSLAEKLVASMGAVEGVSKIEIAGPGFINFTLSPEFLFKTLAEGRKHGSKWGSGISLEGKKIMVEYTDPNPFKEFHIGHLMSNTIGESIARLLQFLGADVKRANYQGDVGLHVAKALWGKMQKTNFSWGEAYAYGSQNYDENKDEIDEINKKVYDQDKEILELYYNGRSETMREFEKIYGLLGMEPRDSDKEGAVYFDNYFYESESWKIGKSTVEEGLKRNVFEKSDGAVIFDAEKFNPKLHTRVFITSKNLPTYEAKELGLLKLKQQRLQEFGTWKSLPDQSFVLTGNEVTEYFKVVMEAAKQLGGEIAELANKTQHLTHGMMRLEEGKMSSRTGNVITGESLINDLTEVAKGRAAESRAGDKEKLAQEIAVAAIKFQILKGGTSKDIIFERERALSVEGDSGPYLQYAHARTSAIVEKAKESGVSPAFDATAAAPELARLIYRFHEIVMRAQEELEPHLVANYLISVASAFNSWYAKEQILDGTSAAAHKVALTDITRQTLKNGLWLLGISAPEKV